MWGKVLGALFGLALLKIPGLFLGVFIGHLADQWFARRSDLWQRLQVRLDNDDEQALFMYSSFAVMGHLAKANGVVTKEHIDQATVFMQQLGLSALQQREAQAAFRDGKAVNFPFKTQVQEFYQCYRARPDVLQLFLEIQLTTVCRGSKLQSEQVMLLLQIAEVFRIPKRTLESLLQAYQTQYQAAGSPVNSEASLAAAYQTLGCQSSVSDLELKRAYKKLMAQHHPDKLVSQGVPAAMLEVAKKRAQDIQAAYELIKQQRAKTP